MLYPKLSVEQSALDPNVLYVTDTTPAYSTSTPGGYGAPNLTRNQITHVIFTLTTPTGHEYRTDPMGFPSGILTLRASNFTEIPESVYRPERCYGDYFDGTLTQLEDGLFDIGYQLYSTQGIPAQTANYHLQLQLNGADQVYVLKNETWLNITTQGAVNAQGIWEFTKLDTVDRYTSYEQRLYDSLGGYDIRVGGIINKVTGPSPSQPTTTSDTPQLVAATSGRVLLTQRTGRRLALVSKGLLTNLKPRPLVGRMYPNQAELLLHLYTASELLDDVQKAGVVNTRYVSQQLTDIQQQLSYLENQAAWAVAPQPSQTFYHDPR